MKLNKNIKKTNMFLIGAPRCGTTSLYHYLKQHPDIFLPSRKELHYFSYPEVSDTYYRVDFITDIKTYLDFYSLAKDEKILGDISPSYLHYYKSAERIKAFNPDAKIVIILRNPIERAISHYLLDVRQGYQKNQFILCKYLDKTEKNRLFYKEYIEVGMYASKVKHFFDVFGRESVCVLLFDELANNPIQVLYKLFKFFEIPNVKIDVTKKYNVYESPKTTLLYYIIHNDFLYRFLKIMPDNLKILIRNLFFNTQIEKPDFSEECLILKKIFRNDIELLSGILDIDLSKWSK